MSTSHNTPNTNSLGLTSLGVVTSEVAASLLGITPRTLRRWRQMRQGPRAVFIGRSPMYRVEEINQWLIASQSHCRANYKPAPAKKRGA